MSVQPTANGISITSNQCVIEASQQVKQLGLDERYQVNVSVDLVSSQDESTLEARADMELLVDVPFPFSLTPTPVFEAGGSLVVNAMMTAMMGTFTESVVADYQAWAKRC